MTTSAASRIQAIGSLTAKLEKLDLSRLLANISTAVQHPSAAGAIEALEEGTSDAAAVAGLIPGAQGIAAELQLAATGLALLDEAVKAAPLAPDFGARLAKVGIHIPALFAVNHGPLKPIFGGDCGPESIFGFTPAP